LNSPLLEKDNNIIRINKKYDKLIDLFNDENSHPKIKNLGNSMLNYLDNNKDLLLELQEAKKNLDVNNIIRIESIIKNQFINFEKNFSIQNKKINFSEYYDDSDLEN
jgi:hypothetical protein